MLELYSVYDMLSVWNVYVNTGFVDWFHMHIINTHIYICTHKQNKRKKWTEAQIINIPFDIHMYIANRTLHTTVKMKKSSKIENSKAKQNNCIAVAPIFDQLELGRSVSYFFFFFILPHPFSFLEPTNGARLNSCVSYTCIISYPILYSS